MQVYKPKDIKLFNLCDAFFKKVLDALKHYLKGGGNIPLITYYEPIVHIDENGKSKGIEYLPYEDQDFRFVGVKFYQAVLDLPEMKTACGYISEKKYLVIGETNFSPEVLLYDAIKDYLRDTGSQDYQEKGFVDTYTKIESFIFNNEILFRSMAKLENFSFANDVIKFDHMHFIKKYTHKECKELYHHPTISIYDHTLPNPGDFRIEVQKSKDKNNWGKGGIETTNEIKQILTTLRLFRDSAVGIATLEVSEPITWFPFTSKACQILPPPTIGDLCLIEEKEIPEIINLWEIIKSANYINCPSLEIAIKRFNYAHEHKEREDSLIDIMIGHEALYMKREERDELRFKLALRVATFLEASSVVYKQKMSVIFDVIYETYKLRSNVVHGSKVSEAKIWEHRIVKTYLSDSIKLFAKLSQKHKERQILDKIDESIKGSDKENLIALFS